MTLDMQRLFATFINLFILSTLAWGMPSHFYLSATHNNLEVSNLDLNDSTIEENQAAGSRVGTITAQGPADFSLADENTPFSIDNNQLITNQGLNYESQPSYIITIVATDRNTGEQISKEFSITVIDINDAPQITAQTDLTTSFEEAITLSLDDLTVEDEDTGDDYPDGFGLNVGSGDNYTTDGNTISPAEGFSGTLSVPVTVNDGDTESEIFFLNVTVEEPEVPENILPVADASNTQTTYTDDGNGVETVTLDATASTDEDGTIENYAWSWDGGSATGRTAEVELEVGTYEITLTVTDNDDGEDNDEFTITVNAAPNQTPTADAGPDQTVTDADGSGNEAVTLNGSTSQDSDGTIESYIWTENNEEIANGSNPEVEFEVGTHLIILTVTDDDNETDTDEVSITVEEAENQTPTADAGSDQTVVDEDDNGSQTINLDGSGSEDPDGEIVSYLWINEEDEEIANGITPSVDLPVGVHLITLIVTDNEGATNTDGVTITIEEADNILPVADAGADQELTDEDGSGDEEVALDGSNSSDEDGTIESYIWTENGNEIANDANPTVTLNVGTHNLVLTVTDDDGAEDSDEVVITINEPENQAPTANAGQDITVTDQDNNGEESISLDGSASSDPDGDELSYTWFNGDTEIATGISPTITLAVGNYTFRLEVSDGEGEGSDEVNVSINEAENTPPVAQGQDVNTDENTSVSIELNASDEDGDALTYILESQPANGTLDQNGELSGNEVIYTPNENFNGSDSFTFRVNDGNDDSNIATVDVQVNAVNNAPTLTQKFGNIIVEENADDIQIDLSGYFQDADGDALSYEIDNSNAELLEASINSNILTLSFIENTSGEASLTVEASDGEFFAEDAFTVTVEEAENIPPVADAGEDQTVIDTDDNGSQAVTLDGSGSEDTDGNIAEEDYLWTEGDNQIATGINPLVNLAIGVHNITLTVTDEDGESDIDEVVITINEPENQVPLAQDQNDVETTEDTEVSIELSASDGDGDDLSYILVNQPANGTLDQNENLVVYTPAANYNGSDTFTFKANDGTEDSNIATVGIQVLAINDAPILAHAIENIVVEENAADIQINLNDHFQDVDNNSLNYTVDNTNPELVSVSNNTNLLSLNFVENMSGEATILVQASDNEFSAENEFLVTVEAVDEIPFFTLAQEVFEASEDFAQFISVEVQPENESQPISYSIEPSEIDFATLTANNSEGIYEFRSLPDRSGSQSFTILATNEQNNTHSESFDFIVNAINDAPVFTLSEDQLTADVGSGEQNYADFATGMAPGPQTATDETGQNLTFQTTAANSGLFDIQPVIDNEGNLRFTPAEDESGETSVEVILTDSGPGNGANQNSNIQTFTINVNEAELLAPEFTISPSSIEVNEDFTDEQIIEVIPTDISLIPTYTLDPESISFADLSINPLTGTVTITALEDASGQADIEIIATALLEEPYSQFFSLTVNAVNDAPSFTLNDDPAPVEANAGQQTVNNFASSINDGDPDEEQTLEFILEQTGGDLSFAGDVSINAQGTLSYQAAPDATGSATFEVYLQDGGTENNVSETQTFTITVNEAENIPPVADASNTQTTYTDDGDGIETVTLDATASTDEDGSIETYGWSWENGSATGLTAEVEFGVGTYEITLTVTDDAGEIDTDEVIIIVNEADNILPVANAGKDQTVTDTDDNGSQAVTLDGSGSEDTDGSIAEEDYLWTEGDIQIATGINPLVNLAIGIHTITLTVTDEDGESDIDEVVITINEPENQAPTANAGQDINLVDEDGSGDEEVALNGSGSSDPDEDELTYTWFDGNTPIANGVDPNVILAVGNYTIRLEVSDGNATSSDEVNVQINEAETVPPSFLLSTQQLNLTEDFEDVTVTLTPDPNTPEASYVLDNTIDFANLSIDASTGAISIEAVENEFGGPTSISVTATDVNDDSNTFTTSFSLQVTAENDEPVVINPIEDIELEENADDFNINISNVLDDVEDNNLDITANSSNTAVAQVNVNGVNLNVDIIPDAYGTALITLTAEDDEGESAQTSFTITVVEGEDATPFFTLVQEMFEASEDFTQPVSVAVQPDDESQEVSYSIAPSEIDFATLTTDNSNGIYNFTALPDRNGEQNFTITAENGQGDTHQESFTFRVNAVNDQPVFSLAQADVTAEIAGGAQSVASFATNILPGPATATDEQAQTLAFTASAANPTLFDGQPAISNNGTLTFTPADDNTGNTSVEVTLTDNTDLPVDQRSSRITTFNISVTEQPTAEPIAEDDSYTFNEDNDQTITLNASDADEGDVLSYTIETLPTNGTLLVNETPLITAPSQITGNIVVYNPDDHYNGTDSFTFSVSDGTESNDALINLTINALNDAPTFALQNNSLTRPFNTTALQTVDDFATGIDDGDLEVDQALTFVLTPDENNTLIFVSEQEPSIDEEGTLTFQLAANASGTAGFTVILEDDGAQGEGHDYQSDPQNFTISVDAPAVEAPTTIILTPPTPTVPENQANAVVGTLTADGTGPVTFSLVNDVANNNSFTISDNQLLTNGALNYENAPSLNVQVTATNGGGSTTGNFPIAVGNVAEPPTNIELSSTTVADGSASGTLVGTLTAEGGDPAAIVTFSLPAGEANNSSFTIQNGNELTTAEEFNFAEQEIYSVLVRASGDGTFDETFSITVTPPDNTAPEATNVTGITTQQATAVTITLTATDADAGDALTYSIVTPPANGSLGTVTGNQVTYTPNPTFFGNDTFTFQANDGTVNSNTASVTIAVNALPVADAGTDQTLESAGTLNINLDGSASSDPDGTIASYSWTNAADEVISTEVSPSVALPVGTHLLTLTVTDNDGATDTDDVTITINAPANTAPVATNIPDINTQQDTDVLITLAATDAEEDALTFAIVDQPANGSVTSPNAAGEVTYSPNEGYFGEDTFTFRANDGTNNSNTATVTINVNALPVANAGQNQTLVDVNGEESVLVDLDGSASADGDGSIAEEDYVWTENGITIATGPTPTDIPFSLGVHEVTLTVTDADGAMGSDVVIITINAPAAPAFSFDPESFSEEEDFTGIQTISIVPAEGTPAANYSFDPELSGITFANVSFDAENLQINISAIENAFGDASISVTATDQNNGNTASETLAIGITPANDEPTVNTIPDVEVEEGTLTETITLSAYFSDVEDAALVYSVEEISNEDLLTATLDAATSVLTLTFNENISGNASITVRGTDSGNAFAEATFNVEVSNVNDAPVISGQAAPITIDEDTSYTINLSTVTVSDADHLNTDLLLNVQDGTNYSREDNSITPALNYNGTLTVPVFVTDSAGAESNVFELTITVDSVNDVPIASVIPESIVEEDTGSFVIDLSPYFSDIEDESLTYAVASNTNEELLSTSIEGSNLQLTVVPNTNGNNVATATITLSASDSEDASVEASFTLSVNPINDVPVLTVNPIGISGTEDTPIDLSELLDENNSVLTVIDLDSNYPEDFFIEAQDQNETNNYILADNRTVVVPAENFDRDLLVPIRVNDGESYSTYQTLRIRLNPVNDRPLITMSAAELNSAIQFNRGDSPVLITTSLNITDVDNMNLTFASISFVEDGPLFYSPEEDVLQFTNQNGISGVWSPEDSTLTLSGSASINDYRDAIRSITYLNTAATPTALPRQLRFAVNDGNLLSNEANDRRFIRVADSNLPPILTDTTRQVPEDEPLPLVVADFSSNYADDLDAFDNSIYITRLPDPLKGSLMVNNTTLTDEDLNPATGGYLVDFNQATNFRYVPAADFNGTDSFEWTALDSETQPGTLINSASVSITVLPVSDAPRISAPASVSVSEDATFSFSETRNITIEDIDNDTDTLTIGISVQEGLLSFNNEGVLNAIVFLEGDGTTALSMRFKGVEADINNALTSLQYTSSIDFSGTDILAISATDPQNNTGNANVSIIVNSVNDLPVLSNIETEELTYTENDTPLQLTNTLSIEDLENDNIVAATISISENFVSGEDRLAFSPTPGITGRVNENRLIFTGNASIEVYEALLRSVTYVNDSEIPQAGPRRINFQVTDVGNGSSNVLSRFVNVVPFDDSIQITNVETEALVYQAGDAQQSISQTLTLSDADDDSLTSTVVRFADGSYLAREDSLFFESEDFEVSWNDELGALIISGDNSLEAYQAALRAVQYVNTSSSLTPGSRLISITAYRNDISSNEVIRELTIIINELPLLTDFDINLLQSSSYTFNAQDFSNHYNDPDNSPENLTFVRLRISELPGRGQLFLNGEVITQEILDTEGALEVNTEDLGQLTYQPEHDYVGTDSVEWNAFDGEAYAATNATVTFNIADLEVNAGTDVEICEGDPVSLSVSVNGGSGNYTFTWTCDQPDCRIDNLNAAEVSVSPGGTTTYFVSVVMDENGVTSNSDTIIVNTIECYGLPLSIPTAFTPNGDGPNDGWVITNIETYDSRVVEVYDRYGKQVFFSEGYSQPWDGARNGQLLPAGTYYYLIRLNNGEQYHRGSVSILK